MLPASLSCLSPRPAGTVEPVPASPPAPQPDALARALSDARVWQAISVTLGVCSLWLGLVALRESRAHRAAVLQAETSRRARVAALETLRA